MPLLQLRDRYGHGAVLEHEIPVRADPKTTCDPLHYFRASFGILPEVVLHHVLKSSGIVSLDFDDDLGVTPVYENFPRDPFAEWLTAEEPYPICQERLIVILPLTHSSPPGIYKCAPYTEHKTYCKRE